MNRRKLTIIFLAAFTLPVFAQIFNFSLRSNNEQLIDEALSGAFVKINQSYELCDTVNDEHFGRGGKDYFSVIPFIAVNTDKGWLVPADALRPWMKDKDFIEYEGKYKPIVTASSVGTLNREAHSDTILSPIKGFGVSPNIILVNDLVQKEKGLSLDSLSGVKKGWFVWLSSNKEGSKPDSLRITSIRKNIDVKEVGDFISVSSPDISELVYGGIYITPNQSSVGQLTFSLTGVIVKDKEGWRLEFPFFKTQKEEQPLTPIKAIPSNDKFNPLKKKRNE